MNKYEQALDNLCKNCQSLMHEIKIPIRENEISNGNCGHRLCPYRHIDNDYCEDYKTLQELIDKTTICGLSLDEAIPVIIMYEQLKYTTHQSEPIEDLMMGQKGQYYINGVSLERLIQEIERLTIENIELNKILEISKNIRRINNE